MKKIALLATGGTIASVQSEGGLTPGIGGNQLLNLIPRAVESIELICKDVFSLDSSNIQPEEWRVLARAVYEILDDVDGVVITHGTDTMAYSAAALTFLLRNVGYTVLFPYAAFFVAMSFVTMLFVRHGDAKAEVKSGLAAFEDMDD